MSKKKSNTKQKIRILVPLPRGHRWVDHTSYGITSEQLNLLARTMRAANIYR